MWMMEMSQMTLVMPYYIPIIEYGNPLILFTPNFRFEDKWSICSVLFVRYTSGFCACDSRSTIKNYIPCMCAGKTYVNLYTQLVPYLLRVHFYKKNML